MKKFPTRALNNKKITLLVALAIVLSACHKDEKQAKAIVTDVHIISYPCVTFCDDFNAINPGKVRLGLDTNFDGKSDTTQLYYFWDKGVKKGETIFLSKENYVHLSSEQNQR